MREKPNTDSAERLVGSPESVPVIFDLKPSILGYAAYSLFPVRRRIVMENLQQAFGHRLSEAERRHLARCFYSHFLKTIGENLAMAASSERRIAAKVDVLGIEHVMKAAEQKRGILILSGHFGNWELSAIAAMLKFRQYQNRFHVIRKRLSPGLESVIFGRFHSAGLRVIKQTGALTSVFDALEKNDAVIFIMDQHNVVGSKAIAVEFFGREAGTNRSLALVARQSCAPVIPAVSHRRRDGRHVMEFHPALEWISADHHREEIYLNTLGYNRVLEKFVLDHPDQWLWGHRRWKLDQQRPTRRRQRELKMGRR